MSTPVCEGRHPGDKAVLLPALTSVLASRAARAHEPHDGCPMRLNNGSSLPGRHLLTCKYPRGRARTVTRLLSSQLGVARYGGPPTASEEMAALPKDKQMFRRGSLRGGGLGALEIDVSEGSTLNYVEPSELRSVLKEPGTVIVDVRSAEERADGHIANSKHIEASEWDIDGLTGAARELVDSIDPAKQRLVFHCMYSRERGPRSALATTKARPELSVAVLRGGFQQCMTKLYPEAKDDLLVGIKPDRWVDYGRQGLIWLPDADPADIAAGKLADISVSGAPAAK